MSSQYRTGDLAEALLSSQEIVGLARDLLSEEEFSRSERISIMLVSSKPKKIEAIEQLTTLIAPPPKRPLYYAQHELELLPRWTRDAIRYMGDYIDILSKHLAFQLSNDSRTAQLPMGTSIRIIERTKLAPLTLVESMKRYNSFLYRPGKHEFKLPSDRHGHRFTSKEVVLTVFITVKLANMIREIRNCNPEFDCHFDTETQDRIESNQS